MSSRASYGRIPLRAFALTLVAALALAAPAVQAQNVNLSDSTFNNADWIFFLFRTQGGNVGATAAQAFGSLGNPSPYYQVSHRLGGAATSAVTTVHINTKATYDPRSQGAIDAVHYSEHARTIATEFNTYGGSTGLALRQNGRLYVARHTEPTRNDFKDPNLPSAWKRVQLSNLKASDFGFITGTSNVDYSSNPDFSKTGTTIEFGFLRANSHTNSLATNRVTAIDNWSVTVVPQPKPLQCDVQASFQNGTLNIQFLLGSTTAADWSVWMFLPGGVVPLWSFPLPPIDPAATIPVAFPFPSGLGNVVIVSVLTTASDTCFDFAVVNVP